MKLIQALEILIDLAEQTLVRDYVDEEERKIQIQAIKVVRRFIKLLS